MGAHTLRIDTLEDARRAIHLYQQTGCDHRIPPIQAVLDGRIAHDEVTRHTSSGRVKTFFALTRHRPTLVLVGDDDDEPTGPAGWPIAQRLLRWARVVVLHGTGAERWHYEVTVNTAEAYGRVLMVETSSVMLPAWMAATKRWAPDAGVQLLVPNTEAPHPVPMPPETVQ